MVLHSKIEVVAVVNNHISARLLYEDLVRRKINLDTVLLILCRQLELPWFEDVAIKIDYPYRASLGLLGQFKFARFYWEVSRVLGEVLRNGIINNVYIVNNDNWICGHLLSVRKFVGGATLSVLVEGLMNYQDITIRNRAAWRVYVKMLFGRLFGYRWRTPTGHLSGAYNAAVDRVVTFAREGLYAPVEKVVEIRFETDREAKGLRRNCGIILENALWQWMGAAQFVEFSARFKKWIRTLNLEELYVKEHPNYSHHPLQRDLDVRFELVGDARSAEELVCDLDIGVVIGTCTTALLTLKAMRPDLRCLDFGSDLYVPQAYFGDDSVVKTLEGVGVEIIDSAAYG